MTTEIDAQAVLLDMDGTLVDSMAAVERIWSDWARDHGFDPADVLAVIHGRQAQASMADLLPDRPHEDNLADADVLNRRETSEVDGVVPIPGAADLLAALADLPHALVTSADDGLARARMAAADLPLPPVLVTAEHVAVSKPDPEGFALGAHRLGVPPEQCVSFEDSAAGIEAARRAGTVVVGIGAHAAAHSPDHHVPDLRGVSVVRRGAGLVVRID